MPSTAAAMKMETYSYETALSVQEQVAWKIGDVITADSVFAMEKPFLPDSLAKTATIVGLSETEQRTLNQIRGHAYLTISATMKEFTLPFLLDYTRDRLTGDNARILAFLNYASEVAKHIHLLDIFRDVFKRATNIHDEYIAPAHELRLQVHKDHPLSTCLIMLHSQLMRARHNDDVKKAEQDLEPGFSLMIKSLWQEEAGHTLLTGRILEAVAANCTQTEIRQAVDEYIKIIRAFDQLLLMQADLDLDVLSLAIARQLDEDEKIRIKATQIQAYRWTFVGSALTQIQFLTVVGNLGLSEKTKLEEVSIDFC
jgi:hypothetical protein